MTAPIFDPNSPRYQRLLSKAGAMSAEQRGLLGTLLDAGAGDLAAADMKNYLALADLGTKRDQTNAMVASGEKKLAGLYGPEGVLTKELETKNDIAMKGIASKEKIAKESMDSAYGIGMARIAQEGELKEAALDFKDKQVLPSTILGGANVILSGAIGFGELNERQKQAKKIDANTKMINEFMAKKTGVLG